MPILIVREEYSDVCEPKCDIKCCSYKCFVSEMGMYTDGKFAVAKAYTNMFKPSISALAFQHEWEAIADNTTSVYVDKFKIIDLICTQFHKFL